MPADADVPPTRFQRWIARHKRAIRITGVVYSLAALVAAVWTFSTDGWGPWLIGLIGVPFVVVTMWLQPAYLERFVVRYDRGHPVHPDR